jgi:hypothetical protein
MTIDIYEVIFHVYGEDVNAIKKLVLHNSTY